MPVILGDKTMDKKCFINYQLEYTNYKSLIDKLDNTGLFIVQPNQDLIKVPLIF